MSPSKISSILSPHPPPTHALTSILVIPLSGGLEILFDHKKKQKVVLEHIGDDGVLPLRDLLEYMRDNLLTDRPELFMQQDTV